MKLGPESEIKIQLRILSFCLFKELQSWPFSCLHVHFLVPFAYWNILRAKKNIHIQMNLRRPDKRASHGEAAAAPHLPAAHFCTGRKPFQEGCHYRLIICSADLGYSLGLWKLCSGDPTCKLWALQYSDPLWSRFERWKGDLVRNSPLYLRVTQLFLRMTTCTISFCP